MWLSYLLLDFICLIKTFSNFNKSKYKYLLHLEKYKLLIGKYFLNNINCWFFNKDIESILKI